MRFSLSYIIIIPWILFLVKYLVRTTGLEPVTPCLLVPSVGIEPTMCLHKRQGKCSPNWAKRARVQHPYYGHVSTFNELMLPVSRERDRVMTPLIAVAQSSSRPLVLHQGIEPWIHWLRVSCITVVLVEYMEIMFLKISIYTHMLFFFSHDIRL